MKLDDFLGSLFVSGWSILMILIILMLAPFDLLRVTFHVVFHGLARGHVAEGYMLWMKLYFGVIWSLYDMAIGKRNIADTEKMWRKVVDSLGYK